MRAKREGFDLLGAFVVDPGVDQVRVKTSPWVRNSWSSSRASSTRSSESALLDLGVLVGRELVEVFVDALGRLDLVADTVDAGEQQR